MKRIVVFADFDWLDAPQLMGELGYESLRGDDSYSFSFDRGWLREFGSLFLCADLNNYPGLQYTLPGHDIFGCFGDALPDRWGRLLLNRREQILAKEEHRPSRRLSSLDYLMGIDDYSRMGGLRFKRSLDGGFVNAEAPLRIPPLTSIPSLVHASQEIEKSEEKNLLPENKWIEQLVHPGSSLGGARPKAGVLDAEGRLCLAKFPSRNDDYDVALWEHLCHLLAKESGVIVSETEVISSGEKHHVLLSRRFDRSGEGRRKHFASAMSLLGLTDGCGARTGNGYLDIVDFMLQNCCDVDANLRQLYRRVAFSVAIGNSDDHFRNHGFLLTPRGWTLSPAYDLNPSLNEYQSLLIDANTSRADMQVLLDAAESYMITRSEARRIIDEVRIGVQQWKTLAIRLGVARREIERFDPVLGNR